MKQILYVLAPLLLGAGILFSFIYADTSGKPSPAWIQAGAAASMLVVTVVYARSAVKALEEAEAARVLTNMTLEEERIARMDQLRPALAIRHRWKDEKMTPADKKYWNARGTYLVNVGVGPAIKIRVSSNFKSVILDDTKKAFSERSRKLKIWSRQDITFGIPIGPDTGNLDTQVEFMSYDISGGRYTPIEDPEKAVVFFIEYCDVFDRRFLTVLEKGQQTVLGPITEEERYSLFAEYDRLVADLG